MSKKEKKENRIISTRSARRTWGMVLAAAVILIASVVAVVIITMPKKSGAQELEEALSLGKKYLSELDYEQAVASYQAAIEIDPKCADAYLGLADVYIAMGEPEEAEKVLAQAEKVILEDSGRDEEEKRKAEEELKRIREKKEEAAERKAAPELTPTPEPTTTPEPTPTPEPTTTPEPTPTPEPTTTPEPTPMPEPTPIPEPTSIPEPTRIPEPTITSSEPTPTPEPTITSSEPTPTPEPTPKPTATPEPTPTPEPEQAPGGRVTFSGKTAAPEKAQIGDTVIFGSYEQDNIDSNGAEPIEWLVLDKKDGKVLLLSKYALAVKPYHEETGDVTWETCTLRSWLNAEFFRTAFSQMEQKSIVETNVKNENNPIYGTEGGGDTKDHIFLLSIKETRTYFSSDPDERDPARQVQGTKYAEAQDCWIENGNVWWWLRSPGGYGDFVVFVDYDGCISHDGSYTDRALCVRPALWLNSEL